MTPEHPTHELSSEEALRRHAAGDRSPEVLAILNRAAWDAFHAPWEAPSPEPTMADDPRPPDAQEVAPDQVQPLSQTMIKAWMDKSGLDCFQHPKLGLLVEFRFSLKSDRCVQLRACATGRNQNILAVNLSSDRRIPPEDFTRALRLCNDWNQDYRWPRAMVEQDYRHTDATADPPPSPEEVESREGIYGARLCLDFQIGLPEGIHQAALETLLDDLVSTSWDFWRLAHDKWGL